MFVMGALHHEDSSLRGDEFQKQERIPWRNVDYSGRKSHCDGTELVKPPISAEFNDFGKNELFMFGAERDQQVNSNVESRDDGGNQMVQVKSEREAKGLTNNWGASWIIVESKGIVVEAKSNTPYDHYNFPVENTKKKPQKKSSRKKRHHFGFLDCVSVYF
ncbi:unnamed protein product [Rhizophagus irregularis]|nr:unnamed protein product [Rhizophagus irregularis]